MIMLVIGRVTINLSTNSNKWVRIFQAVQIINTSQCFSGFGTNRNGYWDDKFSSYSQGCANDYVKDFHVTYETPTRPRLHCFHCYKPNEIVSTVWDGGVGTLVI